MVCSKILDQKEFTEKYLYRANILWWALTAEQCILCVNSGSSFAASIQCGLYSESVNEPSSN
jgi:hypothetical protein